MISMRSGSCGAITAIALSALLTGCGTSDNAPAAATSGAQASNAQAATAAPAAAASPSTSPGAAKLHLEIVGGAHAGTFDQEMLAAGCMAGIAGPGSWHFLWGGGNPEDGNSLNSVTLDLPSQKAADGTSPFTLQVFFGSGEKLSAITVNTLPSAGGRGGQGTVSLKDQGATATVAFDATTANAIKVHGMFDCHSVMR